ncbi:MAG: hypothetical protein PHY34_04705 [Patescibacteria group bacterium]|nr:hypothetical protein [Patescibacteria group bacterium]
MYVDKVAEPVRVFADFSGAKVRPVAFIRASGRRYDITRVNLVYQKRVGDRHHWCFACSDEANTYVLSYNPFDLIWVLEEVQMEG